MRASSASTSPPRCCETAAAALAREGLAGRGEAGARRRHRFRRARPVRPRALRPRLHLLCAVDDPGLGARDRPRRSQCLAPGGSLHIVDFGQQERLPRWFRALLRGWLAKFHVAPRVDLMREVLAIGMRSASRRNAFEFDTALSRLCGACGAIALVVNRSGRGRMSTESRLATAAQCGLIAPPVRARYSTAFASAATSPCGL